MGKNIKFLIFSLICIFVLLFVFGIYFYRNKINNQNISQNISEKTLEIDGIILHGDERLDVTELMGKNLMGFDSFARMEIDGYGRKYYIIDSYENKDEENFVGKIFIDEYDKKFYYIDSYK